MGSIYQTIKICPAKPKDVGNICTLGRKAKELGASSYADFLSKKEIEEFIKKPKDNIILVIFSGKKFIWVEKFL